MSTLRKTYLLVGVLVITAIILNACATVMTPTPISTQTSVPTMALTPTHAPEPSQASTPTSTATTAPNPMGVQSLPNMGQQISPLAVQDARFEGLNPDLADNPAWLAENAVTTVVSPDKRTMLVLTSGFNRVFRTDGQPDKAGTYINWPDSTEYVFVYDISTGVPVKKQVVKVPNTYTGITFDPSGTAFYVSGGMGDFPFDPTGMTLAAKSSGDNVHIFTLDAASGSWKHDSQLLLNHPAGLGLNVPPQTGVQAAVNVRVAVSPMVAGVAISNDGQTLVAVNYFNDSITMFTGGLGKWSKGTELDLRPGKSDPAKVGAPGGEYPFWAVIKGSGAGATAYISSVRDREIVVVSLGMKPEVLARIPVKGQPNKMILNSVQSLLYVVEDQADSVSVIDTAKNIILESIPVLPRGSVLPVSLENYKGANPNSATLSADEKQLYVTLGNLNAVSVIALGGTNTGGGKVVGLIPTGWYPNSVSLSGDDKMMYVVNGKSPTGANPNMYYSYGPPDHKNGYGSNEYNPQLTKAGLQSFPLPAEEQLLKLSAQVATNNRFASTVSKNDAAVMEAVHQGVKHVIFIIKENRTYDQVLGDLEKGNGDPALAEFGEPLTPNLHNLARTFVTLDNIYCSAEVSYDGWAWSTSAQAQQVVESQYPLAYAGRGMALDGGLNRNINTALSTVDERQAANPLTPDDPDVLAGTTDASAPDGPDNEINTGFLWDAALRAKLSIRNYGFYVDTTNYAFPAGSPYAISLAHDPASTKTVTAYPVNVSLTPYTDPYFRGWDPTYPDYWRFKEWEREFDVNYATGAQDLPALSLVRLMNDHTGSFATAIDGVNTPELQQADNDYAVGMLVEKISKSKYADNTLIFVIEDDAQDGPDHVDSHRTVAFVAGAYVKQAALVSTQYNTIDYLRTIEMVLGLPPMNLNDALAKPMADIFDTTPARWSFTAAPAPALYNSQLPLPPKATGLVVPQQVHDAAYWAKVAQGMDFSAEDKFDFAIYNNILWTGLMGSQPYPAAPSGADLRQNRAELLALYEQSQQ